MDETDGILEVVRRLENKYGPERWKSSGSPLEVLIKTILSQNTNDRNRDRAYRNLRAKFYNFQELAKAPEKKIAETIKVGGLHNQKASRIKKILLTIKKEAGNLSLDYLKDMPCREALKELLKFNGVGKKTAGVVLIFSLGKPYFPVDTHIRRVTTRLGLVKQSEEPHDKLNPLIPNQLKYQLHLHLIRYGREICGARKPHCNQSVFRDICKYYKELSEGD